MHGTRGAAATLHAREDFIGDLQMGQLVPFGLPLHHVRRGPSSI